MKKGIIVPEEQLQEFGKRVLSIRETSRGSGF
jgi:hypothetical protein